MGTEPMTATSESHYQRPAPAAIGNREQQKEQVYQQLEFSSSTNSMVFANGVLFIFAFFFFVIFAFIFCCLQ